MNIKVGVNVIKFDKGSLKWHYQFCSFTIFVCVIFNACLFVPVLKKWKWKIKRRKQTNNKISLGNKKFCRKIKFENILFILLLTTCFIEFWTHIWQPHFPNSFLMLFSTGMAWFITRNKLCKKSSNEHCAVDCKMYYKIAKLYNLKGTDSCRKEE